MSKRIKVIRVCLANRNIGGGLLVIAGAWDCAGSGTIGTVRVLGLRELSPNPSSSFPGFPSLTPPRVHDRGVCLLGVSGSGCQREDNANLFTESRWG